MGVIGEVLHDTFVHASRIATGTSHTLGVAEQLKKRWDAGSLFNGFAKGVPFSTTGKIMVAGWGLQNALTGSMEGWNESRLGSPSGQVMSATPAIGYTKFFGENQQQTPNMMENAEAFVNEADYHYTGVDVGATGDLVFAMNKNRRG